MKEKGIFLKAIYTQKMRQNTMNGESVNVIC
jgi:hypothetical protein